MNQDHGLGLMILLGVIGIGLFGGAKNASNTHGIFYNANTATSQSQSQPQLESQTQEALKAQIKNEETSKGLSPYRGIVTLSSLNKSTDPAQEYAIIRVANGSKQNVTVTGWTLRSMNYGTNVTIPKGVYLYFTGMVNGEEDITLTSGDTLYLVTGISPNGSSFKTNICSGYLTQFQTFVPNINNECPAAKNENLSSIPNTVNNDACMNYIEAMPRCRIQTDPLPQNWSYECTHFIQDKINYPTCVNTHKDDKNFQIPEWHVYLKRSERIWKNERDAVILYDAQGKVVDSIRY